MALPLLLASPLVLTLQIHLLGAGPAATSHGNYSYDSLATPTTSATNTPTGALGAYDQSDRVRQPGSAVVPNGLAAKGVSNGRLGRALGDDYRGGPNPIGDGSALDAARHTVRTGELVGGSTHLEKAVEMRDRYARILRRGGLSSADEAIARSRLGAYGDFVREHRLDEMMRARGLR